GRPRRGRRADSVALPHECVLLGPGLADLGIVDAVRRVPARLGPDHDRRPAPRVDGAQPQRAFRRPRPGMGTEAGGVVNAVSLRHVLLLLQGALGGLVTAEALVLGVVEHSLVLLVVGVVAGALSVLPVVLAFRLLRGRRARGLAVAFELLLL